MAKSQMATKFMTFLENRGNQIITIDDRLGELCHELEKEFPYFNLNDKESRKNDRMYPSDIMKVGVTLQKDGSSIFVKRTVGTMVIHEIHFGAAAVKKVRLGSDRNFVVLVPRNFRISNLMPTPLPEKATQVKTAPKPSRGWAHLAADYMKLESNPQNLSPEAHKICLSAIRARIHQETV